MDDRQTISYEARPHLRARASLRDATHRCVERAAPREALARVPRLILTLACT